jgi:glycosyltransferase involved in cell wall biosynthesis
MLISILMPVKNEGKYLRACLDSIRQQTHQDWQLIVVDDHSNDKTTVILEEYTMKEQRIQWSKNEAKGILPALQQAFERSAGAFITRMDGDDLMPSYKLAVLLDLLKDAPPRTIATGKVRYFSESAVSDGYLRYEAWINERCEMNDHWKWVYRECVIASPNWLCRREDLIEIGGFTSLKYPEDYDLVLKWYEQDFQVNCSKEITHLWREHAERTSRNSPIYDQHSFFQLKMSYLLKEFKSEQFLILGLGQKAKLCKEILTLNKRKFDRLDKLEMFLQPDLLQITAANTIILVAVYPEKTERVNLQEILETKGFVFGENAFYV